MERKILLMILIGGIFISFGTTPNYAQNGLKTKKDTEKRSLVSSMASMNFELGDKYLDLYRIGEKKNRQEFEKAVEHYKDGLKLEPENIYYINRLGYTFHLERRLNEASEQYIKVLNLDPPQLVTPKEFELVIKLAPKLYVNSKEFFDLEDVVVILHPEEPLIEYSFFWDDDIDCPGDNDPTDHEKIWIQYDPETGNVVKVYTYFHRAILSTEEAVENARIHDNRALINIQWGGHGSLPINWEKIQMEHFTIKYKCISETDTIKNMNVRYDAHLAGIQNPDHPFAKQWPKKFEGTWEEYITFNKYINLPKLIKEKRMVIKSRWTNAVIDQYFLDYQSFPKKEWPMDAP